MADFGPHSTHPLAAPFWAAARESRLVLPFGRASGRCRWYPHEGEEDALEWREIGGGATLYSFSVLRGPINPEFAPPCAPALVLLDEAPGIRLVSQVVDCDFALLRCDMRLELCFRELHTRTHPPYMAPVFRPAAS